MARQNLPARWLLLPILGFSLWALAFALIYALQALGCGLGWDRLTWLGLPLHRALLTASLLAALIVTALILRKLLAGKARFKQPPTARFLWQTGLWGGFAGLAAIAVTFSPLLFLANC